MQLIHENGQMEKMESSNKYQYYLFDLDGTLTDPGIGITNSVMYALEKYGIRVEDRSELYCFIGPPLIESFQKYYGFSKGKATQAVGYYREYFRDKGLLENQVYEGIREELASLRAKGKTIVLATSKPEEFAIRILKHFDLLQYFDFIGAATMDGSRSRKDDVIRYVLDSLQIKDRSRVLMIGDRRQDIEGAKANGIRSAGVLFGYGDYEELTIAGADYIIGSPQELAGL